MRQLTRGLLAAVLALSIAVPLAVLPLEAASAAGSGSDAPAQGAGSPATQAKGSTATGGKTDDGAGDEADDGAGDGAGETGRPTGGTEERGEPGTERTPTAPTPTERPAQRPGPEPTRKPDSAATQEPDPKPAQESAQEPRLRPGTAQGRQQAPAVTASAGTPQARAGRCAPESTATVQVLTPTVRLGGELRFRGAGWCHPDGSGSRVAVKIETPGGAVLADTDSPVHANDTIWAILDASADGSFEGRLQLPDGTTATSSPAMTTSVYHLRLLSGSLRAGDKPRTVASGDFTVVGPDAVVPYPPDWPSVQVDVGGATAWVEDDLGTGDGQRVRIKGIGWTRAGGGASAIAVKLGRTPDGDQYSRAGGAVVAGDPTIWALLKAGDPAYPVTADGSFEVSMDLPPGLVAGQYLTVSLFTGKFATGDVRRTVTTRSLQVGGRRWVGGGPGSNVQCRPTSDRPTVRLTETRVSFGGVLRLTGAGWCNPEGGGSRIAVKIDDGTISHTDSSVAENRTIWAVLEARPADGTIAASIRLPDGTAGTSSPALRRGAHTLRLLTGSLRAGDPVRSVQSEPFTVGRYRPNGIPDPLGNNRFRPGTRGGVAAGLEDGRLRVTVPGSARGDWVFLSLYTADGSPSYPWNDRWFRLGAGGALTARLPADTPGGSYRLAVQSGAMATTGALLGWDRVRVPEAEEPVPTSPLPPVGRVPTLPPTPMAPAGPVLAVPAASRLAQLRAAPRLPARLRGTVLTVDLSKVAAGTDPVYLRGYRGDRALGGGWVQPDRDHRVRVDLARLGEGRFRVGVQAVGGRLLGVARADLRRTEATAAPAAPPVAAEPAPSVVTPTAAATRAGLVSARDAWLGGLGILVLAGTGAVLAGIRRGTRPGATS